MGLETPLMALGIYMFVDLFSSYFCVTIKKENGGALARPFLHLTVLNKKKKLVKV